MKKLSHSLIAKTTAFILAVAIFAVTAAMTVSVAFMLILGNGYADATDIKDEIADSYLESNANKLYWQYYDFIDDYDYTAEVLKSYTERRNYYYTICDGNDEVLFTNFSGQGYSHTKTVTHTEEFFYGEENIYFEKVTKITLYLKEELPIKDQYTVAVAAVDFCYPRFTAFILFSAFNVLLLLLLCVFLCGGAGHKRGEDGVKVTSFDKIPLDIFTACFVFFGIFEFIILDEMANAGTLLFLFIASFTVIADFALLLLYVMSIAVRVKTDTLFKNTLVWIIISAVAKFVGRIFKKYNYIVKNIPLVPQVTAVVGFLTLFNLILALASQSFLIVFLYIAEVAVLVPLTLGFVISLRKLQKASERIADGDFEYRTDTENLTGPLKSFGESLNNIGNGMQKAVNAKIKSERLKTELITNVSHDIKTPLTSIINYVDLLGKEKIESENAREYLDVLSRQSLRLKKLIEDLVEASKASTGNITMNPTPCELGVLLTQTVGEYEERAENNGLSIVLETESEPVTVMADGRHLWRIFDNLMNNICKYSMPGTRVYLSLKRFNNKAVVTFRNISKATLNVSSDELTERFVRGDSSRNTEGSGLGLSIAKSLVELQNGKMVLTLDGDLFKVLLTFNTIANEEEK